ncbi:MAG: TfoX/Sxy family DNA transformation protein [Gilliamella sp.]|uniref:TfoX/Sxy family DNA transformation protein n=1 Tax=Gilliamella TaxID=1193503 RepID=UPI000A1623EF|nr:MULTISPECIES: TfoX/Sxy family DNA transformation protein [Gilliamella]MCO6538933.1 TfoX/Sxy family DNA transformation protein [Gilliamella sp.]MCO6553879.1 TfoX/Sxy family DNA transformation protein [Gilliamella sp.]MCO6555825.1 TfoX/Sxy family DNA transformation protein [Gilliamella sp.]
MCSTFANRILTELSDVEDISIKTFFGGFSVNSKDIMFGWVTQKSFYLRGHPDYRSLFIDLGMQPLSITTGMSTKLLDYYKVGNELFKDHEKLFSMVQMVIKYTKKEQYEKNEIKAKRIKELPNMTLSLERLLCSVGIKDVDTFQKVGYLNAYYKIKQKKETISINILFVLYSSLHRFHVATLSKETKKEIELEYQCFLNQMDNDSYKE